MYLVCPLSLILNEEPACPTYELLQVIYFNWYIPLEFALFWIILSLSYFYMLFLVRKAIFRLESLNGLITLYISGQ
jgi:hypothetical protein